MNHIPLYDDWYLMWTPRWEELGESPQILLMLLLFLGPLALIVWLYQHEMRQISSLRAWSMLFIRSLVVILIASLIAFQPKFARDTEAPQSNRIVVALDLSEPMHVADPQRTPLEKLQFAKSLDLVDGLVSVKQLDAWIAEHQRVEKEKGTEFRWVAEDEFKDDAERRALERKERKQQHDLVLKRIDEITRLETAQRLLTGGNHRLLAKLAAKHNVEVIGFGANAADGKLESIEDLFRKPAEGKESPGIWRSRATNLSRPLERAQELAAEGRGKVLGVVLLSTGQHNYGSAPGEKAIELKDAGIPLFPIELGSDRTPPDVSVVSVVAPTATLKDIEIPVKVRLRVTGLKAQELKVLLHRPGQKNEPLAEPRTVKHDGEDREYYESFQVKLDKVGQEMLQVTVEPQGENVKEISQDNNFQRVVVNVADDTSRVLLVDGEGRWEFHYIWQALLRDRSMKVKSVLYAQPRIGKVPEEELKKVNHPAQSLPPLPEGPAAGPDKDKEKDKDPIYDYDCIILGDAMPDQLTPKDRIRLEKYVSERGGALVVLAGKRGMPLAFMPQGSEALPKPGEKPKEDPLLKMLPIEEPKPYAPEEGFPVRLTDEGRTADFLKMEHEGGLEESLNRWAKLPRHYWGVIGKAKPGATVLATVAQDDDKAKPEDNRKRQQEQALFIKHNYGLGRVFFIGLDSTWRWRYRTGDLYHHRFWSQTIRWSASERPLATGNTYVRFGTPQAIYRDDEPIKLTVRLNETIAKLPEKLEVRAKVITKDAKGKEKVETVITLTQRQFQERMFEADLRGLPPGEYEIELESPALSDKLQSEASAGPDGKIPPLRTKIAIAPADSSVPLRLEKATRQLKDLAEKNELGELYSPESASELIKKLSKEKKEKGEHIEDPLWLRWETIAILISLLAIEWVLRKWSGLP